MFLTSAGQLAVNEALPEDLRDYNRTLDKAGVQKLLQAVAEKYPDRYRDVAHELSKIGYHSSYITGGHSFDLKDMRLSQTGLKAQQDIRSKVNQIYTNPSLTDKQKEEQVISYLIPLGKPLEEAIYNESLAENNPLAYQVKSGARGNKTQLKSLRGPDLLYVDHKDRPIPIPIIKSYSQGLSPAEYYAGTFGARKGVVDVKFATQDSGFLSKQMNQIAHRLVVTKHDHDTPDGGRDQGLPVETSDPDNEGSLLSQAVGGFPRNTVLTPKVISELHKQGINKLLVRSPITMGPPEGGVYARDVGVREKGSMTPLHDNVGIAAAQALSEPLSQAQLASKHSGGIIGAAKGVTGFKLVNEMIQVPKIFKGGAAHAKTDGKVQSVQPAPQGGNYITVDGERHYIGQGFDVKVKPGDTVEAGDILSDGIPNPSEIVKYKGVGEGSKYFIDAFRNSYKDMGLPVHRRNVEILAKGLINHVRMTDELGEYNPGDVVPYSRLAHYWKPRENSELRDTKQSMNMYLEKPILHYSIGTRVKPSVIKNLQDFNINNVLVHKDPPPFEPEMMRGMENLAHDPDWMTRFLGSYLQKNLLKGTHRGDISDEAGTSYVPGLSRAVDFGRTGLVRGYNAGKTVRPVQSPKPPEPAEGA